MEYLIWIIIWIIIATLVMFIIYFINRKSRNVSPSRNIPSPRNVPKPNIRKDDKIWKTSSLSSDNEDEKNAKLGIMKQSYFQNKIKDIQDKLKD